MTWEQGREAAARVADALGDKLMGMLADTAEKAAADPETWGQVYLNIAHDRRTAMDIADAIRALPAPEDRAALIVEAALAEREAWLAYDADARSERVTEMAARQAWTEATLTRDVLLDAELAARAPRSDAEG